MNGSGFLATVEDLESDRVLLVTCKHVIPDVKVAMSKKCTVSIDCVDGKAPGTKISGEDLFDASIFKTDEKKVSGYSLRHCITCIQAACIVRIYYAPE